jgi:Rrf2 family nitric oxide-sensitive transcriptional repressor
MQLNLQTDYALRILMALAAAGRQMSVDEIASGYAISRNHLAKVAQRLQALGYIASARGRGGGVRLVVPPAQVNVGRVVRSFERLEGFVDCMNPASPGCIVNGMCGLKHALGGALADFLAHLDDYTLADLVPDAGSFVARLEATRERGSGQRSASV